MNGYIEIDIPKNCDRCVFGTEIEPTVFICEIVDRLMPINGYENRTHMRPYYCPIKEKGEAK